MKAIPCLGWLLLYLYMQKNVILASTSTLYGEEYLAYLLPAIKKLFDNISEIIFIPFARPGGISHDEYTHRVSVAFSKIDIKVKGLHTYKNPGEAISQAQGFFTGGGNTFLLVKQLHEGGWMYLMKEYVEKGIPYLGTSAGSNIAGVNMQTTNDMPIVYPKSFHTMGIVPFNLNPHYMDPISGINHMGESRETRIREFHTQNDITVAGLREGSWIQIAGSDIVLRGNLPARIFEKNREPYELPAGSSFHF